MVTYHEVEDTELADDLEPPLLVDNRYDPAATRRFKLESEFGGCVGPLFTIIEHDPREVAAAIGPVSRRHRRVQGARAVTWLYDFLVALEEKIDGTELGESVDAPAQLVDELLGGCFTWKRNHPEATDRDVLGALREVCRLVQSGALDPEADEVWGHRQVSAR